MQKKTTQQILASAILMGASAVPAFATDYTWNGGTDGNWTTTTNWTPNGLPGAGDTVDFVGSSNDAVNLNGSQSINSISFTDGNAFTLDTSATVNNNTVTLGSGGSITKSSGASNVTDTIYSALAVSGTTTITNSDGNFNNSNLVLAGNISGSGTLNLNGSGTAGHEGAGIFLQGDNSGFTGNISVGANTYLGIKPATSTNNTLGGSGVTVTLNDGVTVRTVGNAASNYAYIKASNNWVIAGAVGWDAYYTQGQTGNVQINNGASWNISDGGGNGLYLSGVISGQGTMDLKAGGEILEGTVSNTLSGTIINESGSGRPQYGFNSLYLAKTGGAIAIAGPLTIKNFGSVVLLGDQEIASNVVPEIDAVNPTSGGYAGSVFGAGLQLRGHTQTLGGVTGVGNIEDEFLGNGSLYFGTGKQTLNTAGTPAPTTNEHGTLILDVTGTNSYTFAGTMQDYDAAKYQQTHVSGGVYYYTELAAYGKLALIKTGTGTQILTGNSTFTGATTISGGVLALQGTGSLGNTAISVTTGGTFAPNQGTFAGSSSASLNLGVGSTFDMTGDNGGTLGKFTLNGSGTALTLSGATLKFDLGTSLGNNDELVVLGDSGASVSGANLLTIDTAGDASLTPGDYTLISDAAGGLDPADFSLTSTGVLLGANAYTFSLSDSSSTAEILTVTGSAAVPEPASLGLLGMASVGLLVRRRRRKTAETA